MVAHMLDGYQFWTIISLYAACAWLHRACNTTPETLTLGSIHWERRNLKALLTCQQRMAEETALRSGNGEYRKRLQSPPAPQSWGTRDIGD